jgi:hypothetical protein
MVRRLQQHDLPRPLQVHHREHVTFTTSTLPPNTTLKTTLLSKALGQRSFGDLLAMNDEQLAGVDPLEMNLLVAKGIPALAHLDIGHYQALADLWARRIRQLIAGVEGQFWQRPHEWRNDINFFRLGALCQYVDCDLGVRYRGDQRAVRSILYTDPSHLFLNGVMDTRRGTCGNMAALHVVLGWRLGWPISLACAGSHFFCRYDDGYAIHNIEATKNGSGGFHSHPDEYYRQEYSIPDAAIGCGFDLRAVTPRELLGLFVGLRARHERDVDERAAAERDYLLARYLFPTQRVLCREQFAATALANFDRFEPFEPGHPTTLWSLGDEVSEKHHVNRTQTAKELVCQ